MTIREIEKRGALDIAHRALQTCGQIFRYAIATGRAEYNPSSELRGALKTLTNANVMRTLKKMYSVYLDCASDGKFISGDFF